MDITYHEQTKIKYTKKLRLLLDELPSFLHEYFRGIGDKTSSRTKFGYATDLKTFFIFLINDIDIFNNKINIKDFSLNELNLITSDHIEIFLDYITYYEKKTNESIICYKNDSKSKSRKLSAIRAMFNYFYKKKKIEINESSLVDFPKLHQKQIVHLKNSEVTNLLNIIESGEGLTKKQLVYHAKNMKRDLAIVTLFLGTGMRISECVGINITDIDFDVNSILITRKGGNQSLLYFGDEVESTLIDYINERKNKTIVEGHENALFLSSQNKRLTDRAIQMLVHKYSKIAINNKKISPHKLRSTFGTNLYQETNDIYLVADLLGHADVNTTKKYYAHMEEKRRKDAVKHVKLRK